MTGYGSAKGNAAGFEISVELKSVNNRYLETSVRMPRSFLFAEEAVTSTVQRHISRGKVDVFVSINAVSVDDVKVSVNEPLLRGYLEAVKKVSEEYGLNNDLTALNAVRFPDVLLVERSELDAEAVSAGICSVLEEALNDFDAMREREGIKLRDDVLSRLETISGYVSRVETEAPQTVEHYRQRLEKKMAEVLGTAGIDQKHHGLSAPQPAPLPPAHQPGGRAHLPFLRGDERHLRLRRQRQLPGGIRKRQYICRNFNTAA